MESPKQPAKDHAARIANMQWKMVYASRKRAVGRQSPSLRGPAWPWGLRRGTSKRAKGHERDLVIQLRDYEANGGDLDAIRQHIDDAASARVWDMFLANYKCFSRTGDELQMLLPDRVRTTRHFRSRRLTENSSYFREKKGPSRAASTAATTLPD